MKPEGNWHGVGVIEYQVPGGVEWLTGRWLPIPEGPPSGGEEKVDRKI